MEENKGTRVLCFIHILLQHEWRDISLKTKKCSLKIGELVADIMATTSYFMLLYH